MTRTCGGDPQVAMPIADNGTLPIDRLLAAKAEEIIGEVAKGHGLQAEGITGGWQKTQEIVQARKDAIRRLYAYGFNDRQIAEALELHKQTVNALRLNRIRYKRRSEIT